MNARRSKPKRWKVVSKNKISNNSSKGGSTYGGKNKNEEIIKVLLKNRGIKTEKDRQEFLNPKPPEKIKARELGINEKSINTAIRRIRQAKVKQEKIIIYGDYDADGICASAILWEVLYSLKFDVTPYIPERFSEGYGINSKSIENLKSQFSNLKLIITVDNGIVANETVDVASKLGIDVIICDHHQPGKKQPRALSIIHTDKICASAIAWLFVRELLKEFNPPTERAGIRDSLELVAIGTIADQIPLIGENRSFVKYGLIKLNTTERLGLNALYEEAQLIKGNIGSYAVGFIIAPRLNAAGRLEQAIDSLRLLCTKNTSRARELARYLGRTNSQRQKIVEEVVLHAKKEVSSKKNSKGMIIISHESYHEGVIGLAAAKLVEEFWRPAIVLAKGKEISKASARSIPGFNIIEFIHRYDTYLENGGGHPMAAGFSIKTEKIEEFSKLAEGDSLKLLTDDITTRTLKIDTELDFDQINSGLQKMLSEFEPVGLGNPTPIFMTRKVKILDAKVVGIDGRHLKLTFEDKKRTFGAVAFGMAGYFNKLTPGTQVDIAYSIEENTWNGNKNLELKIRDIKLPKHEKRYLVYKKYK